MIRKSAIFFISMLACINVLHGDDNHCCEEEVVKTPFLGGIEYDYVASADFDEHDLHGDTLRYNVGKVHLGTILYYNEGCEEGAAASLGYLHTYLNWDGNPYFDQKHFNNLYLSLGAFSHRLCDWVWKANATFLIDTDRFNWEQYLTFNLLLWGRYAYSEDLGVHVGLYAITGMKVDRVYPILGVDWNCWRKLKLHLVFPVDINAAWEFNDCWSTGAAIRFFESRHKTGKHEPLERAVWVYRTYGAEWFVTYNYTDYVHFNLHGGYTIAGKLKVANRHYDDPHHFRTKSAPYIGGRFELSY